MKARIIITIIAAMAMGTAQAQYYTDRKHDQGTDTLKIYTSWQDVFSGFANDVAVNPNADIWSPFKFKFNPTEKNKKPLKQMLQKEAVAVALGDTVWFANSNWLKSHMQGAYIKYLEEYVPLYFNDKILFTQYLAIDRPYFTTELPDLTDVYAGVGSESEYYGMPVAHFVIDVENNSVNFVDDQYLLFLLEQYPDLKQRYISMEDQQDIGVINYFFWEYIDRISDDPTIPRLPFLPAEEDFDYEGW